MKQLEILDLAMLGILRLMDTAASDEERRELDEKLKRLAEMFVLEQSEQRK
jgi:hypothetical protein